MPTHKKGHDKDKYYHLAKDQGYRSRAAFKLIQINKRFDFLSKARVLIDLCAAPGGWCQVAAKFMPQGSIILGVDLLPIRTIRGVKTLVQDITTAECRRQIANELQSWKADVVLCDGAPNIGSAYSKDAYVQNELVLAALKTATDHLIEGGTFCSKIYRSVDYNSLIWVLQQLFEDVQAIKPSSSRSQSSEIFIVCQKYTAPKFIDPKLLDPNHVFKEVADPGLQKVDVLHKKHDQSNKRHRTGYEEGAGLLLQTKRTVAEFISTADPVRMLTDATELWFSPSCEQYSTQEKTTIEIKECLKDLRVLSKADFKRLLKWRQHLKSVFEPKQEKSGTASGDEAEEEEMDEEAKIEAEINSIQTKAMIRERKEKKKSRSDAARERQRQALGISNNVFEVGVEEDLFSFATALKVKDIEGNDLPDMDPDEYEVEDDSDLDDEFSTIRKNELIIGDDDLDDQLETAYHRYVSFKKERGDVGNNPDDEGTLPSQKKKKLSMKSAALVKAKASADGASFVSGVDMDGEGEGDDNMDPEDSGADEDSDSSSGDVKGGGAIEQDLWFKHPIFGESLVSESSAPLLSQGKQKRKRDSGNGNGKIVLGDDEFENTMASMPKTDKEVRQERRRKATERNEKRKLRQQVNMDDSSSQAVDIIPSSDKVHAPTPEELVQQQKTLKYRELIKKGVGLQGMQENDDSAEGGKSFDVVPSTVSFPEVVDGRSYDSDNEDYDSHDRVMTLALGTLMLDKSRQKAMIDASYNRFSWNDPKDLPSWFLDDETRHNKPQVPVPNALVDQIKNRFQSTGTKEIKKVAEARMRKRKRALSKLKAAKKKATSMAENSEMTERQKVKAIQSALKNAKVDKPGKVYVVAKKTKAGSVGNMLNGNKGKLKFVDKRMKKETRAARRKAKDAKGGKKRKH